MLQLPQLQKLADWLARQIEDRMEESWSEVCIVLVDDEGITKTNREYFEKDRPTDVISFRYDPVPGEDEAFSGDLIINVDRAIQVGLDHEGINYELALYMAHGFDHLTGSEDDTPEKKEAMLETEMAWLEEARKEGLVEALFC